MQLLLFPEPEELPEELPDDVVVPVWLEEEAGATHSPLVGAKSGLLLQGRGVSTTVESARCIGKV